MSRGRAWFLSAASLFHAGDGVASNTDGLRLARAFSFMDEAHSHNNVSDSGDNHPREVLAWVSFGRVGSTTMRGVLRKRAVRHGWAPRDGPQGVCRAKKLNFNKRVAQLPCSDVESGAVVQTDYGYCSLLGGARRCRYFTLLRDPIDMIVSQYNWFCLSCQEGVQCVSKSKQTQRIEANAHKLTGVPQLSCPDMSIVDYARHYSNQFTVQFSGKKAECSRSGQEQDSAMFRDCIWQLTEVDYQAAEAALHKEAVLVLRFETMWSTPTGRPSGMELLADYIGDPEILTKESYVKNRNKRHYTPSKAEVEQLKGIMHYDLRLYKAAIAIEEHRSRSFANSLRHGQAGAGFSK